MFNRLPLLVFAATALTLQCVTAQSAGTPVAATPTTGSTNTSTGTTATTPSTGTTAGTTGGTTGGSTTGTTSSGPLIDTPNS